jgi:hypothetical protein
MFGSIREPQQIEHRRSVRVLKTNCRQFLAANLASPTAKGHVLEAKPNRTKKAEREIPRPQTPPASRRPQARQF